MGSSEQIIENDTLEIAGLEYEVGGNGAEEPAELLGAHEGIIVICVVPK